MKSTLPLRGKFKLNVYQNGGLIQKIIEPNLIVDAGFNLIQLLVSAESTDKQVSKIAFGELISGDPIDPLAEWTEIPDQFTTKVFDSITLPSSRSISFNWSLQGDEGNGYDISYFGLLAEDDTLFAAKTRSPIAKTADIVLQGTWIINF